MSTKMLDELEKKKNMSTTVSGGGSLPVSGYKTTAEKGTTATASNPRIQAMQQYLQNTVGGEPTESDLLQDVREKLLNRQKFSYDHNTDARFQQYLDTAKRSGKLAMQDTIGQASALTGGYGNSYAQSAGQQAYNAYLQDANEMIPEFEDLARARYEAETAALTDKYSLLQSEHESAKEDYWNRYGIAREDWYTEQERQESEKQYADSQRMQEIELMLALGDYDSLDKLGYNTGTLRAQQTAEMAAAYRSSSSVSTDEDEGEGDSGLYSYSRIDEDGGYTVFHDSNGKEIKVETGVNPYTRTVNKTILDDDGAVDKTKTFKNGYQPNHIVFEKVGTDGKTQKVSAKLKATGDTYTVKGREQNIWKTEYNDKTQYWLWDGEANDYMDITVDYLKFLAEKE